MHKVALYAIVIMLSLGLAVPLLASAQDFESLPQFSLRSSSADSVEQLVARRRRRRRRRSPKKPPPPPPKAGTTAPADKNNDSAVIMTGRHGPARVDFDDRLIQGQTNKSGAIYIFERKSSDLRSMVRRRKSFRKEIFRSIE